MVSQAACRRTGLVLVGIVLGLTLAVWRGVIKPPTTLMSKEWRPVMVSRGGQRTVPDSHISQAVKENVQSCVTNFASFRATYHSIDRHKMEIDRVESHSYLTTESRVLEVGGYTGVDADKLIKRYNPYYLALEPVPRYYTILEKRFKDNPKYKLFKFGLGRENKTLFLNIDSDATSLFRAKKASNKTKTEEAHIHEITGFFKHIGVYANPIDLITINCEGCEFELLELITTSEIVKYLKNIQFQFHLDLPGIANQEARYCGIITLLSRTHTPTFQYSYTWQSWRLKGNVASLAVWQKLGLVLFCVVLGFTLAVWHGVIEPSHIIQSAIWNTGTVSHDSQRTPPDSGFNISQARKEEIQISSCVTNFASFRAAYYTVNRPKMEIDRVESHSYLTTDSRVLEVGGYTGVDADKLIKRYNPYYLALEPVPRYYTILEKRFKDNPKYKLYKFGLGRENKTLFLNIDSDATSLFRAKQTSNKTKTEEAHIHEITGFFKQIGVYANPIDLITINCEGCEFELLELITTSEIVKYLKNIQFQFHLDLPGIANQEARYCGIITSLSRTHRPTFQYSYTWQSWRRKTF